MGEELSRLSREDRLFAELVLSQELCSEEQVSACASTLFKLIETGMSPVPSLGKLLVEKGYLTPGQAERTLKGAGTVASPSEELPPEAASGEPMGKYVRVSKLGAGGMGEVWKAWDRELRRWVALKFLKYDDPEELARFKREAQTAANLNHPNIGAVYEVGEHEGSPFISMQFVDGQTLSTFPRNDQKRLVELIRDAALAVHSANQNGIIHRDLKPANIMVEGKVKPRSKTTRRIAGKSRTEGFRIYVMDFGLAKQTSVDASVSVSGSILGTPSYMPPEQAQGRTHEISERSDVYGLGATLYDALADRPPVRAKNVYEVLKKVVEEDPKPPAGIDPDLRTIVMKCLEKDPRRRYPDARELADDLTRYLEGEPIEAHPPSTLYRLRKRLAKKKALVITAALGLLLTVGLSAWLIPQLMKAEGRAEHEAAARKEAEGREAATRVYAKAALDLHSLRMRSYRSGWQLTDSEFEEFELLARQCEEKIAETGESAEGRWVIGRVKEVGGDWTSALEEYGKGLAADPDNGLCLIYKSRLLIHRAIMLRYFQSGWERSQGERWIEESRHLLEGAVLQSGVPEIELALARGYARVARWESATEFCEEMLQKFRGRDFAEEFMVIAGLSEPTRLMEETTKAIAARPSFPEAYFWRACVRQAAGDLEGAINDCSRAIEINPRFAEALASRGASWSRSGEYSKAIEDLDRALGINPHWAGAYSDRGLARFNSGDLAGAMEDYERAIEINPELAGAYLNRGLARAKSGDIKGAERDYNHVIKIRPQLKEAYLNRGILREGFGDLTGAIEDFGRAIEISSRFFEAYNRRAYARGRIGDFKGSIEDYDRALAIDPESVECYANRGVSRFNAGDLEGAFRDYERALEIDPRSFKAYTLRGLARSRTGDLEGAMRDHNRAIELNPRYAPAYSNRGLAWEKLGDLQAAIRDYDKAIQINPKYSDAYYNRANARYGLGKLKQAVDDFNRSIELNPRKSDAYNNRGLAYDRLGDLERALKDFDQSIRIDPQNAQPYNNRGIIRKRGGDTKGAIEDYDRAIELDPRWVGPRLNRAIARNGMGDRKGALEDLNRVLEIDPRFLDAYGIRGAIHFAQGDYQDAIRDFDRALELAPSDWKYREEIERGRKNAVAALEEKDK